MLLGGSEHPTVCGDSPPSHTPLPGCRLLPERRREPVRQGGGPSSQGHHCSGWKSENWADTGNAMHTLHWAVRQRASCFRMCRVCELKCRRRGRQKRPFRTSCFKPAHLSRSSEAASGGGGHLVVALGGRLHGFTSQPAFRVHPSPDRPRREGQRGSVAPSWVKGAELT